jgi:hypothetical protein
MSKTSSKLIEISKMFDEIDVNLIDLSKEGITDMITIIKKQNDTRYQPNVKHKMEDIILITLFDVMAKCNEWTEIESFAKKKEQWLRNYLELPNGIPSHDTIQRVISVLDPSTLYSDCINYLIEKIDEITSCNERDILSADGKQSNGSKREVGINKDEKPVNTMSVYSTNYGLSLIQDFIDEKLLKKTLFKKTISKEHNGIIIREYYMTDNIK